MQTALELIVLMATLTTAALWCTRHLTLPQADIAHRSPTGTSPGDRLYAWHRAHRHPLHCEVRFVGNHQVSGQGRLLDISRTGWRIRSRSALVPGMDIQLSLYLPDRPEPLTVDHTIVRWSDGREFGVELVAMSPESAARLSDFFLHHASSPDDAFSPVPETALHG